MANLHLIAPAVSQIDVEDFHHGGSRVIIGSTDLSGPENAELFYEKAKKGKRTAAYLAEEAKGSRRSWLGSRRSAHGQRLKPTLTSSGLWFPHGRHDKQGKAGEAVRIDGQADPRPPPQVRRVHHPGRQNRG
jgi:hypothetical protein